MMNIYWLEQTAADVPARDDWLSAGEKDRLAGFRISKRRDDWRLGRWTGKCLVAACLGLPETASDLATVELKPAMSGAPEVFIAQQPVPLPVSLSHRAGRALCVIANSGAVLGCDLELIEPRSDLFIADYFTESEQELMSQACAEDRSRLSALLWSAKESALKALHMGLLLDTRSVTVTPALSSTTNDWSPLQVDYVGGQRFRGWWRSSNDFLRTLIAVPGPTQPIPVALPWSSRRLVPVITENETRSGYR